MNFKEVVVTILAAVVIRVALWLTMCPPPREEHISMIGKQRLEHRITP